MSSNVIIFHFLLYRMMMMMRWDVSLKLSDFFFPLMLIHFEVQQIFWLFSAAAWWWSVYEAKFHLTAIMEHNQCWGNKYIWILIFMSENYWKASRANVMLLLLCTLLILAWYKSLKPKREIFFFAYSWWKHAVALLHGHSCELIYF